MYMYVCVYIYVYLFIYTSGSTPADPYPAILEIVIPLPTVSYPHLSRRAAGLRVLAP